MTQAAVKIAILFSGRGSNLKALAAHLADPNVPGELVLALTNRPDSAGLAYCESAGIATLALDHTAYDSRDKFDTEMDKALRAAGVELICCAGFMRLLTADFVNGWHDRIINIHPSLLPKYKGLDTHARALEAGDEEAGCTVHYVRPEMDDGPIIVQKRVSIRGTDTRETLSARVLEQEHIAYREALDVVLKKMAGT